MWDALRLDVRHSFRSLRRSPTFSAVVIVTLTLAVGGTAAIGSLLNALVLRKPAVPSPDRLVILTALETRGNVEGYFYADTLEAYRTAQRSFSQMALYGSGVRRVETRTGIFDGLEADVVSPGFFELVGARPAAGRFFNESDDAVVVISEGCRQRLFGKDPAVGEAIEINGAAATIIGVTPASFNGLHVGETFDLIVPFALMRSTSSDTTTPPRSKTVVARLAPGVSIDAARAELRSRWPPIQSATLPAGLPQADREALLRQRLDVAPFGTELAGARSQYATTLGVLLALMTLLLAIACANLAGLTLARSLTRRHQVAIRLALGGSARRVFWQLLLDGMLLSAAAFAAAIPLAFAIVRAVAASLTMNGAFRSLPTVTPDVRVLAAMALLTALIGLAIGVVSAWQSVSIRVDEALRRGRGTTTSFGRFGRALLVAQVALSMTLLVGAGLFTATLARLRANDTSLQSQRILFARAFRDPPRDTQLLTADYYRTLVTELAHIPGTDGVALSVYYPTYFGFRGEIPIPTDYHYTRADGVTPIDGTILTEYVSPGFFDLFRFQRLEGRDVSWADGLHEPGVALLSASLARALFPSGNAVGRHIRAEGARGGQDVEVIGVVADGPYVRLDNPAPLVVFRPIMQEVARAQFPLAYVRVTGDLATVRDGYSRVVKSLGHRSLRFFILSSDWMDYALSRERLAAALASFAAALTLLLACIGVYGLLAYSVTARVREIGVRRALGASPRTVLWMIVRDGLAIAVPGVLLGTPCAWAAARIARAELYGISPGDPRMLLMAAAVFLATALAASLFPALRASRVAPVEALREE